MRHALLVTMFVCLACAPLDRRAPFGLAGYVDAVAEVGRAVRARSKSEGAYVAGWARVAIDVPPGAPLAGYGDRDGAPHTGTADPAYVRAFVVGTEANQTLVFTADVLLIDPRVVDAVADRLAARIEKDDIFYTASHTHSGPGGFVPGILWSLAFGPYDDTRYDAVVDALVKAATFALDDVAPAAIGTATIRVPGLIKNRVEKNGPVDDTLLLTRFERTDGRVAALWVYGCHAVTRSAENLLVSADYPGDVARAIEGHGVELLAFAAGGVGSANPRHERKTYRWLNDPLIAAVKVALKTARARQQSSGRVAHAKAAVTTPEFRYRVTEDTMVWSAPINALVDMPVMTYGALTIGNTVFLFMPSEISGELTRAMRRDAARRGVKLAVMSFNGTYTGYIVPRRVYNLAPEDGEEMMHYETHVMSFFGPYGGDILVNLGLRIARGVYGR